MSRSSVSLRVVLVGALLVAAAPAEAHFLFLRVGEHAEAGRAVEVFFSERADAGDPKFIEKISGTQLRLQSEPGKFQTLESRRLTDRLRAAVPSTGAVSITGRCEYGVLTRKVPFLLRYYPKGVAGDPERLAALTPDKELPVEILLTVGGAANAENKASAPKTEPPKAAATFTVIRNGKPVAKAKITTIDDDLTNEELETGDDGAVAWTPKRPGMYCLYTSVTTPEKGEHKGTAYTEIREFATLSFRWPLASAAADAAAVDLFEKAIAARSSWAEFPGFRAKIEGVVDGRGFHGAAKVGSDGKVSLEGVDSGAGSWVEDQLGSIVLHRKAAPPRKEPPSLRFADDETHHPLGRLVMFSGGQFASSYRVKDDQLMVVNRNMGKTNMTITIVENSKNAEGKFLPHAYNVHYWDAATGKLSRVEAIQNRWTRVGKLDLPSKLSVTTASEGGLSIRQMELSEHELTAQAVAPQP